MNSPRPFRLLGWLFAALLVLLFVGLPWSTHTKLTFAGALLEISGIVMLAWDLAADPVQDALSLVRRVLTSLRGAQTHTVSNTATIGVDFERPLVRSVTRSVKRDPMDQLRDEMKQLIARVEKLDQREQRSTNELYRVINEMRREIEGTMETRIVASETKYLSVRLTGFGIALLGSAVLAAANLL